MDDIEKVKAYYTHLLHEIIESADSLNTSRPLAKITADVMKMQRDECCDQIRELADYLLQVYAHLQAIPLEVEA